jgi:hypothetical protein
MKYTDQKQKTVYKDIEVEVPDGISYFKTFDEDGEQEYLFKFNISKNKNFDTLYNILVTRLLNYDDKYHVNHIEYCESELPFYLRGYFCGEQEIETITEYEYNAVKQEILNKL